MKLTEKWWWRKDDREKRKINYKCRKAYITNLIKAEREEKRKDRIEKEYFQADTKKMKWRKKEENIKSNKEMTIWKIEKRETEDEYNKGKIYRRFRWGRWFDKKKN